MDKFYQKIKEGGYDFERLGHYKSVKERDNALLLDPLAWQALGKAEGWKDTQENLREIGYQEWWLFNWHRFIDALSEEKSVDEFFEKLLN